MHVKPEGGFARALAEEVWKSGGRSVLDMGAGAGQFGWCYATEGFSLERLNARWTLGFNLL